jgi:DNA polymerase elongation subunit (family B)
MTLLFHIIRCESYDECLNENSDSSCIKYVSYLYGRTYPENKSICVKVYGYQPYFYIDVPKDVDKNIYKDFLIKYLQKHIEFIVRISPKYYKEQHKNSIDYIKSTFVKLTDLNGYRNGEKKILLKLVFHNEKIMRSIGNYLSKVEKREVIISQNKREPASYFAYDSFRNCKVYDELKFDNKLKMCHERNINPSGWVQLDTYKIIDNNDSFSKQLINIKCNYIDLKEVDTTKTDLDINKIPKLIMLSYDLECYSNDDLMPQYERETDVIIQIGTIFRKFGEKESYKKIIVTQKECSKLETNNVKVISCKNEKELLIMWAHVIQQVNPDIIYGYNTFGFDDQYIIGRTKLLNIMDKFLKIVSRSKLYSSNYICKELTSSGLGQNIFKYIDMRGRITIDIMSEIKKNPAYKFPSYSLNYVSKEFIGQSKNDLSAHELFDIFKRGNPDDIAKISDYCVQDCELVHNLVDKLSIIPSNIGMARVCHVGIDYIINRGQGIKVLSLLAYQIMQMPINKRFITEFKIKSSNNNSSYGGAAVLQPKIGIHTKPIAVLDFSSLYPSIMIGHNLSLDTIVKNPKYIDNKDNFEKLYYYDKKTSKKTYITFLKNNSNTNICGVLPTLLKHLLSSRKKVKDEMALTSDCCSLITKIKNIINDKSSTLDNLINMIKELNDSLESKVNSLNIIFNNFEIIVDKNININITNNNNISESEIFAPEFIPFITEFTLILNNYKVFVELSNYNDIINTLHSKIVVLNALQLAYKISANSVYGQTGAPTSNIYCPEIAAVVTTLGQYYINLCKKYIEKEYKAECIYGDSVTYDTPLLVKNNNNLELLTIEELFDEENYYIYHNTKQACDLTNYQIWTESGWTNINKIIRHKINKNIYRVSTNNGIVDVTEDHSLLDKNKCKITPKNCKIGKQLLHSYPKIDRIRGARQKSPTPVININENKAKVLAAFLSWGMCSITYNNNEIKYNWNIVNDNIHSIMNILSWLNKGEKNTKFKIEKFGKLYKIIPIEKSKIFYDEYHKLIYTKNGHRIVPMEIIQASYDIKSLFLWTYLICGGGTYNKNGDFKLKTKSKITAQSLYLLIKELGDNVIMKNHKNTYTLIRIKNKPNFNCNKICKLENISDLYSDNNYVYDLETDNHHFHMGIGKLIGHNTDSIFIKFNIKVDNEDSKSYNDIKIEKLLKAKELGYKASNEITNIINRNPIKLAYEKVILPLILMGKKNYCGLWHEEDIYKSKFKMMGCKAKKREYAPIVKKLFIGLVNKIVYSNNLEQSIEDGVKYFYKRCSRLDEYPIKYFVITKSVKSDYKNPRLIAHKVLADRITFRDPGNSPRPGSRIAYAFIDVDINNCTIDMMGTEGEKRMKKNSSCIYKEHILKGYRIETPDYIKKHSIPIDYEEYFSKQITVPIFSLLRLELSLDTLEYLTYKITNKDIAVRIEQKKNRNYTTKEEEITECVKVKVMKKNRNKIYKIPEKEIKYIDFIPSFQTDLDNGIIELIYSSYNFNNSNSDSDSDYDKSD